MADRPAPEILLGHAAFLKNLARALLRDEQAAEDVVQDAFLAAIEKPPAPGNLRAWLASVVRHLSLSRLRSAKRRSAREQRAGGEGGDGPPPPEDVVARMELQRRVVAAVLALDEPYRTAIARRYLDEWSLAEIAREAGVPVATARTRLRRGLDRLRARLDDEADGRGAWSAGLLALLARETTPAAPAGAAAAATGLALVAVAAVVALFSWPWSDAGEPPRPAPPEASPSVPPDAEAPREPASPEQPPSDGNAPDSTVPRRDDPVVPLHEAGFVLVPAGTVEPGATRADYERRATRDELARALVYDVWGQPKEVHLPAFFIGRHEVTNAQWKHYLDRDYRLRHTCKKGDTLVGLAREYVKFRGRGVTMEWRAIYAMNWRKLVEAWTRNGLWREEWDVADPPVDPQEAARNIAVLPLPEGLTLTLYRHRIPRPWYGWCKLSGLRIGQEYFDPTRPAAEAFVVPDDVAPLRADDFAAYPVRDVSPNEMLRFAEWAGCHLPSEYEFERAGRLDRPRTDQHTRPGTWRHEAQSDRYAYAGNKQVMQGPARVDDPAFAGGDTKSGVRHLLGNVYELTRTFYDLHPGVVPKPPTPDPDLTNYALTAKGGSFGDTWRLIQLSTRTPQVGHAHLSLKYQNRADSLGLRLVRHARPGWDLMSHSLLRLCYDRGNTIWLRNPIGYAMRRARGIDVVHAAKADAPYIHVRERALGITFVPKWMTTLRQVNDTGLHILGALRSDVPIRAGVRMSAAEYEALERRRAGYRAAQRRGGPLPPKPPEPDAYERSTRPRREAVGVWREKTVPPGEWFVVSWNGYLGLAGKGLVMPPDAILAVESFRRVRVPADMSTRVVPDAARDRVSIRFAVEEQALWALSATLEQGWPGRASSDHGWLVEFDLPVARGALREHDWNTGD